MRKLRPNLLVFTALLAGAVTLAHAMKVEIHEGMIQGRIYESSSQKGLPGLTVKLIPPTAAQQAERLTRTDENGEFRFTSAPKGRYLLEVYQGITILYRRVIDTSTDTKFEVVLKEKQR